MDPDEGLSKFGRLAKKLGMIHHKCTNHTMDYHIRGLHPLNWIVLIPLHIVTVPFIAVFTDNSLQELVTEVLSDFKWW